VIVLWELNKTRGIIVGTIAYLRTEVRFDRWHRVILACGQQWVEKIDPTGVWVIDFVEPIRLNDEDIKLVHIKSLDNSECESVYTEAYFRKWFYEVNQPQRKKNMIRAKRSTTPSLKRLLARGPVVGEQK
jgi:hypothetical protein